MKHKEFILCIYLLAIIFSAIYFLYRTAEADLSVLSTPPAVNTDLTTPRDAPSKGIQASSTISEALNRQNTQDLLGKWILRLETKENCPPQGKIDSNGYKSYGVLCFQKATFDLELKRFGLKGPITDNSLQFQLAYDMISTDYSSWRNWYNSCVSIHGIGLPPKVVDTTLAIN